MAESISYMLRDGFKFTDIMTMTLRQINGLINLSMRHRANDDVGMALIVRMAQHSEGAEFKKFINRLVEGVE